MGILSSPPKRSYFRLVSFMHLTATQAFFSIYFLGECLRSRNRVVHLVMLMLEHAIAAPA